MKVGLNKKYKLKQIINFCNKHNLITVDCLKEENLISVEEYNNGELGDCIFEFKRIKDNLFKLIWIDYFNLQNFLIKK